MESLELFLKTNSIFVACIVLFVSFAMAYSVFPVLIYLNFIKKLSIKPNVRSSHKDMVPTLGGVGMFVGISIVIGVTGGLLANKVELGNMIVLQASLLILFFTGIKDDLLGITSGRKFSGQLVATILVIVLVGLDINNFQGLLGLYEISLWFSIPFTIFVFILIINAYNLIDGIDGLAAGYALVVFAFFAVYFLLNSKYMDAFLSCATMGALFAFLKYNISKKRKIFMGDTGSMVIGFLIAYQACALLFVNQSATLNVEIKNAPVFILALLSYPFIDTLRVILVRLKNKKSPFKADRNHLHHKLVDMGMTHIQATGLIVLYAIAVTALSFVFQDLNINVHLLLIMLIVFASMSLPFLVIYQKNTVFKNIK